MFYRMINTKRDEWFNSSECTVRDISVMKKSTYLLNLLHCNIKYKQP
jgi:hypothetical protein